MLVELIVASLCANNPGQYKEACSKATQATYTTIGANKVEGSLQSLVEKQGKSTFGNDVWTVGGAAAVMSYKTVKNRTFVYKIKTKGATFLGIDYIKPELLFKPDNKGGSMGFGWSW